MKVVHTVNYAPGFSGMYNSVRDLVREEKRIGLEADVIDDVASPFKYGSDGVTPVPISEGDRADIICWHHAIANDWLNEAHRNIVIFLHGTPEYNFLSELHDGERSLSLLIGASNFKIPRAFVTLWKRHLPYWESFLKMPVHYVPAWTNLDEWKVSTRPVDPGVIRIALMDYWRTSREPFGLIAALERLRRQTKKKVEINVWGLTKWPSKTYAAILQWLVEDDVMVLKGTTQKPMEDIFHQNDLVLSMSTEETRVVREAYSCGVPVVCGRGPLHFTKYAVDSIDADRLAATIEGCHEDLVKDTERVRQGLRKYAEKHFDVQKSMAVLYALFKDIVKEHGSVNYPKFQGKVRPIHSVKDTCDHLSKRLSEKKPTCFLRTGDGDLLYMTGAPIKDNFATNSPELQKELIEYFTHREDGWMIGCVAGAVNEGRMRQGLFAIFGCDETLRGIVQKMRPDETLEHANALAYRSVFEPEWFFDFLRKYVHGRKVLFVGGERLCQSPLIKRVFDVATFVPMPMEDAYYALNGKMEEIKGYAKTHDILICAAGMASRPLAKRLWKDEGIKIDLIDIGSICDGVAGVQNTRTWINLVGDEYRQKFEAAFMPRRTDIVVLTHKAEEKTIRCFEALAQNTENYRVIWVDNGSGKESIEKVKPTAARLAECELIPIPQNEGFSKGVNRALRKILSENTANYVVLINNDVIVSPKWLDGLFVALAANGLDAVGPLTSADNPHSVEAFREVVPDLPKFTHETMDERASVLRSKFGAQVRMAGNMLSFFCCLLTKEAFEQVGLLDENLFCYGEDNDFFERCARLRRRFGIALGVYVHHDHGATSSLMGVGWKEEQQKKAMRYLEKKWPKPKPNIDVSK